MKNLFYFRSINKLGGTEQFLYEIAKKYHIYDITVVFDEADEDQLNRLRRFVRCRKRVIGQKYECEKAFLNFNIDIIDDLICEDITFVVHAIFNELGYRPPTDPRIKHVIAVSGYAGEQYFIHEGVRPKVIYNPLTLEPKQRVLHMVAATRLAKDQTKGGNRLIEFIKACDRYCDKNGTKYLLHLFTDDEEMGISKNVCVLEPRIDVRPFIADSDILIQLSNNMETFCYSINEALEYGVHVCTTPLTVLDELNIPENARFTLNWDMSNVDSVVEQIFTSKLEPFEYKAPSDNWDDVLVKGENTYYKELEMKYLVKPVDLVDKVLDKHTGQYRTDGKEYLIDGNRYEEILAFQAEYTQYTLVQVIKEVPDKELKNYKDLEKQFIGNNFADKAQATSEEPKAIEETPQEVQETPEINVEVENKQEASTKTTKPKGKNSNK